jgi:hypothetical protein
VAVIIPPARTIVTPIVDFFFADECTVWVRLQNVFPRLVTQCPGLFQDDYM